MPIHTQSVQCLAAVLFAAQAFASPLSYDLARSPYGTDRNGSITRDYAWPEKKRPVTIDADLSDWEGTELRFVIGSPCQVMWTTEASDWTGPLDASVLVSTAWNAQGLLIAATVVDDAWEPGDGLRIVVDNCDVKPASQATALTPELNVRFLNDTSFTVLGERDRPVDFPVACRRTARGFVMEASIPWNRLRSSSTDKGCLLGVQYADADSGRAQGCLSWKPARFSYFGNVMFCNQLTKTQFMKGRQSAGSEERLLIPRIGKQAPLVYGFARAGSRGEAPENYSVFPYCRFVEERSLKSGSVAGWAFISFHDGKEELRCPAVGDPDPRHILRVIDSIPLRLDNLIFELRSSTKAVVDSSPILLLQDYQEKLTASADGLGKDITFGELVTIREDAYRANRAMERVRSGTGFRIGWNEYSYRSKVGANANLYAVRVPRSYDGASPIGVLVYLHGSGGDHLVMGGGEGILDQYSPLDPLLDSLPVLLVQPRACPYAGYAGVVMNEVLQVIQDVKLRFNVDTTRVYLGGSSMGGRGTFEIGTACPGTFAAFAPHIPWITATFREPGSSMEPSSTLQVQREEYDNAFDLPRYLGNLQYAYVHQVAGLPDPWCPAEQAMLAHVTLRKLGVASDLSFDTPGYHGVYVESLKRQLTEVTAYRKPVDRWWVDMTVGSTRFGERDFVRVDQKETYRIPARVRAYADTLTGRIEVTCENVRRLTIMADRVPRSSSIKEVRFGDGTQVFPLSSVRTRSFVRAEGAWRPVVDGPVVPLLKNPRRAGGLDDYTHEPFIVVYGTRCSARDADSLKAIASRLYGNPAYGSLAIPVKADSEVTYADVKAYSMVLYGTYQTNRVLARWQEVLPFRFEKNGTIRIGRKVVPAQGDHGLTCVFPNPDSQRTYLVVRTSTTIDGLRSADRGWFPEMADFAITRYVKGDSRDPTSEVVDWGWFGNEWRPER